METPVLSQSQKSKALSGNQPKQKKKQKKNKIRNVLASYSATRRLSIKLTEEDSIMFEEHLKAVFRHQPLKAPKWDVLKKLSKEERGFLKKSPPHPLIKNNIIFGINGTTRTIENKTSVLVLIANDVNPPILTRHIHEGCSTHQIPIFEIPDLKNITNKCFGFPSMVMSFVNMPDCLGPVVGFLKGFGVDIKQQNEPQTTNSTETNTNINMKVKPSLIQVDKEPVKINSEIYLKRDDIKVRCFVPPVSSTRRPTKILTNVQSMDYIELPGEDNPKTNLYKNLKVKRIQPNSNRLKGKKK